MNWRDIYKLVNECEEKLTKRLTHEDVKSYIDVLEKIAEHDDEEAHRLEKALWKAVLSQLASDGNALSRVALRTEDVRFSRWFA